MYTEWKGRSWHRVREYQGYTRRRRVVWGFPDIVTCMVRIYVPVYYTYIHLHTNAGFSMVLYIPIYKHRVQNFNQWRCCYLWVLNFSCTKLPNIRISPLFIWLFLHFIHNNSFYLFYLFSCFLNLFFSYQLLIFLMIYEFKKKIGSQYPSSIFRSYFFFSHSWKMKKLP